MLNRKLIVTVSLIAMSLWVNGARATVHTIKTIGETFDPDTVYVDFGDSIKFIIGIGHDVREITELAYDGNTTTPYPGGFMYAAGTWYYVIDEVKDYYYCCTYHMASGQMKGLISVNFTVQNPELKSDHLQVYPNPCEDYLRLSTAEENISHIIIYDLNGKTFTAKFENGCVDVSGLQPGFYLIDFGYGYNRKRLSFIKK